MIAVKSPALDAALRQVKAGRRTRRHPYTMLRLTLVLTLISAAGAPVFAQPAAVARGHRLAEAMCASCHAIGPQGDSPAAGAPRFRDLANLEPGRSIDEIFARGVLVMHPGMPSWALSDRHQADLLAYLRTLQHTAAS